MKGVAKAVIAILLVAGAALSTPAAALSTARDTIDPEVAQAAGVDPDFYDEVRAAAVRRGGPGRILEVVVGAEDEVHLVGSLGAVDDVGKALRAETDARVVSRIVVSGGISEEPLQQPAPGASVCYGFPVGNACSAGEWIGGAEIYTDTSICSAGFNFVGSEFGQPFWYASTAGHCGRGKIVHPTAIGGAPANYTSSTAVNPLQLDGDPNRDFWTARIGAGYRGPPPAIASPQRLLDYCIDGDCRWRPASLRHRIVTGDAVLVPGVTRLCKTGRTTGTSCGTYLGLALNGKGVISGLDACGAERGDSGGVIWEPVSNNGARAAGWVSGALVSASTLAARPGCDDRASSGGLQGPGIVATYINFSLVADLYTVDRTLSLV